MGKILIVDDVPTEATIIKQAISQLGHDTVIVSDGLAAVEAVQNEEPDMVLLDIVLPKMDGFQVCRKIKKNKETKHIPVILISSKCQDSDKFWGLKQGASEYLTKPFDGKKLESLVKQYMPG